MLIEILKKIMGAAVGLCAADIRATFCTSASIFLFFHGE